MRQLVALLSFWQNRFASNHIRGGKRECKSESSKQTSIAQQFTPQYCEASFAQKRVLLNAFIQTTG